MKKLVLLTGLVISSTAVFAANEAGTYTIGAGIGYYDFANRWYLHNDKTMPFIDAGYNFTDNWGIRYQLDRMIAGDKTYPHNGMNGWLQSIDAVYHFSTASQIKPYVTMGLGLLRTNGYLHSNDANFVDFNGGVGAQYFFSPNFALDAQVQDLYTNSKTTNDLLYTIGVDYQFGGHAQAMPHTMVVAPVPAPAPVVVVNTHHEVAPPDVHYKPVALFKLNSAKVNDEGKANIKELAEKLKANPHARVRLDGFADDTGTFAFNKYLSTKRAESVSYWLQKEGISSTRIDTYGFGNAYPYSSNETVEGRAQNRRVADMILTN